MKKFLLGLLALLLTSSAANASTFVANPQRSVYVRGVVNNNSFLWAGQIESLSRTSKEPIDIIINSPGGSIYAGNQTISAMEVAKSRGVTLRCFVPTLAASMGYQIFSHCNERYTLANTMLLWHPARIFVMFGAFTTDQLLYEGEQLRRIEKPMAEHLIRVMGVNTKFFNYHYRHETMWLARDLIEETDFFEIVDDFKNVKDPYVLK